MPQGPPAPDEASEVDWNGLLHRTAETAAGFLAGLPGRPVRPDASLEQLRAALGGPLPEGPAEPAEVVDALSAAADPGVLASPSGRFFGFVIGGALPAAVAADWLTTVWDQNAGLAVAGPAASVAEEVAAAWLAELLGLPPTVSAAFVTGCQMASTTGLAAARHHVLARQGWDVERRGLIGAPPVHVVVAEQRHATIDRALRFLGFGDATAHVVASDEQGRMRVDETAPAGSAGPRGMECTLCAFPSPTGRPPSRTWTGRWRPSSPAFARPRRLRRSARGNRVRRHSGSPPPPHAGRSDPTGKGGDGTVKL